ncbi:hypothetical protein ACU8KH_01263 [Lachancea thermotolerans]
MQCPILASRTLRDRLGCLTGTIRSISRDYYLENANYSTHRKELTSTTSKHDLQARLTSTSRWSWNTKNRHSDLVWFLKLWNTTSRGLVRHSESSLANGKVEHYDFATRMMKNTYNNNMNFFN